LDFSTVTDPETRSLLQEQGVAMLAKPFEVADLISHVRALSHKDGKTAAQEKTSMAGAGA
jgi:hypothetical protein